MLTTSLLRRRKPTTQTSRSQTHPHPPPPLIVTQPNNSSAKTILSARGFKPMTSTVRMYKGVIPRGHDRNVYGLACLELG